MPAGVEVAVAENEPTAEGAPWKEVAVSEDELLRAKVGGGRAAAILAGHAGM